jgi:GDSL-like Lipase/Acylhydrolase
VKAVIPLWKEIEYFKEYQQRLCQYVGQDRAKYIVNEAIYVISIGTNDFLENYYAFVTGRILQFTIDEFEDFLVSQAAEFLTSIYMLGARKMSFAGLSPMGCLPLERTTNVLGKGGCNEKFNQVSRDFNAKLQWMISDLCTKLPGLRLRYLPVYDSVVQFISNPSQYGN